MNLMQNLLYDSLIRTSHVEGAVLIKIKEGLVCASPPRFHVRRQTQAIIDAFKNASTVRKEGLNFREKNYKCVRTDKNAIYAKCGLVLVKTKFHILMATYREGMFPSVCVEAAENLGEPYLRRNNQ
uniref:Profilin-4 n=1 Tax=Leptobrachium leishanense TaxID=445787 RepID=A0A8C5MB92_9ANUR